MLVRLLRKREFEIVSLTLVLTIDRPANCGWCHLCQLGVHEDELHHVELGDQLDEEDG